MFFHKKDPWAMFALDPGMKTTIEDARIFTEST
ncbi:hypothetical protein HNR34_003056 [Geobacillus subterraneus]